MQRKYGVKLELDDDDFEDILSDQQPSKSWLEANGFKDKIPLLSDGWGKYGSFRLVGNGEVTNGYCGHFVKYKGCLDVDAHNRVMDKKFHGMVFVRKVHNWCNKPSCPVCFLKGWAIREAGNIEGRIFEGKLKFGVAEHIIASVPFSLWGCDDVKKLRRRAIKALKDRGVIGGVVIFHAFRYRDGFGWFWSPHLHCIGFVLGGYSRCRNCKFLRKRNCQAGCDGFYARNWELFQKDRWYCKVLGKRQTIFGTAWYQLSHASYSVSGKRRIVATWFGCCSTRKMRVTKRIRKRFCPICHGELYVLKYKGSKGIVKDFRSPDYEQDVLMDYKEDGEVVWELKPLRKRKGNSGSKVYFDKESNCWREDKALVEDDDDVIEELFPAPEVEVPAQFVRKYKKCAVCGVDIFDDVPMTYFEGKPVHVVCLGVNAE